MRGPLRNQRTVALRDLLRPYPHYTMVQQWNTDGVEERYHSFQLRVQRAFANGFNFLLAYNYNRERMEEFFNKEETFVNQFRWEDGQRPRHRMTIASTYEFPFGRGRRYLSHVASRCRCHPGWMDHQRHLLVLRRQPSYGSPNLTWSVIRRSTIPISGG